jgi:hypothetical protein
MKRTLIVLATAVVLWKFWSSYDRSPSWKFSELSIDVTESFTVDSLCNRNIVGIQPFIVPQDFLTEDHFYGKMKGYFDQARSSGFFKVNTVVLLPEYLGTWLVIAGEKESVASQKTIAGAMSVMVLSNPIQTLRHYFITAGETDRLAANLFSRFSKVGSRLCRNNQCRFYRPPRAIHRRQHDSDRSFRAFVQYFIYCSSKR